jgi:hypothetical protein
MKLTDPQWEELSRLSASPQSPFGKGRARVQHNLHKAGLAAFTFTNGTPCVIIDLADRCVITDLGRARLAGRPKP